MLIYPDEEWEPNTMHLPEDEPEHIQYLIEYLLSDNYQTEMERDFESGVRSFAEHPRCENGDPVVWQNIVHSISREDAEDLDWPEWTSPEDSHRLREWIADRIDSKRQTRRESQNSIDKRNAWKFQLALEHLDLYVLAERYELSGLQKLASKKMVHHIDWRSSPRSVLDLAAAVYPYIGGGDEILGPRLRKRINKALEWISMEGIEKTDEVYGHYVQYGGGLASDLTAAYEPIAEKDFKDRLSSSAPSLLSSEKWHEAFADYMPL